MIRDPSDGSVKEPDPQSPGAMPASEPGMAGPVIDTDTSGLPVGSRKPKDLARLEKSREWLKDYHAGKFKPEEQP